MTQSTQDSSSSQGRAGKIQFIRDLKEKEAVSSSFLVKFSAVQVGKTGKPYMNIVLMDRTGELEARIWDDVSELASQVVRDAVVWIEGKCQLYQGRKQVVIKRVSVLREDDILLDDYLVESQVHPDRLLPRLESFVQSMQDPYYKALAESIMLDDQEIYQKLKVAPAAKSVHHAYKGGLLEHILSITETLDFMAKQYEPYLDRDLLFLGGFLHDIGKLWELEYERSTDYTMEGRLIGHLVMGVELVTEKIRQLEQEEGRLPGPFPEEKKLLVKHVILAHHGKLEYGSPKRPKCLEALVVHYIDDLDSKINSIRCFIEQDMGLGHWTSLHRQFERFFFKPEWARDATAYGNGDMNAH